MDPCAITPADGLPRHYDAATPNGPTRAAVRPRPGGDAHMNALIVGNCNGPDAARQRGALLRWLDTLAEWQMRHSYSVISRGQTDKATITSVTQPSSANERSSTSPCDR